MQRHIHGRGGADRKRSPGCFRKTHLLTNLDAFLAPVQFGRDKEIDVQSLRIIKIDAVSEFRKFLDAGAGTAPERVVFGIESFPRSGEDRKIILRRTRLPIDCSQPMVQ
jgi:hypothetical protein